MVRECVDDKKVSGERGEWVWGERWVKGWRGEWG